MYDRSTPRTTAGALDWGREQVLLRPRGIGKQIEVMNLPLDAKGAMAFYRIAGSDKFIFREVPQNYLAIAVLHDSHEPCFEYLYSICMPEDIRTADWETIGVEDPTVLEGDFSIHQDGFRSVVFSNVAKKPAGGGVMVKLSCCPLIGDPASEEQLVFGPQCDVAAPDDLVGLRLLKVGPQGDLPYGDMIKEFSPIWADAESGRVTGVVEYTDNTPGRQDGANMGFVVLKNGQLVAASPFRTFQEERATHVSTGGPAHLIGYSDTGEPLLLQVYNRRRSLGYPEPGKQMVHWGGTYMVYRLEDGKPHPRSTYFHDTFILPAPVDSPPLGEQYINFVSYTELIDDGAGLRVFSHVGDLYPMVTEFDIERW